MSEKTVDARGMACPLPVVNAKKAVEEMHAGDILTVLVDNEIAVQNLLRFAGYKNFTASSEQNDDHDYSVIMHISETAPAPETPEEDILQEEETADQIKKGMIVVLSANVMGTGDEKLGKTLMKAFVFALTRQDHLPETILCYNTGAYLTCENADTLEDMKLLAEEGVKIFTCGTCLDFYGIKEKLAVGEVTNMYDIVETMENAKKVIRP